MFRSAISRALSTTASDPTIATDPDVASIAPLREVIWVRPGADRVVNTRVDFDGPDDPTHPRNWAFKDKVKTTIIYGFITMTSTWSSSVYSPDVDFVSAEYGVSSEVSMLGISLLLIGFGFGPLLWGPFSEMYGRKFVVLLPVFCAGCFSMATGAAKNIETVLITRFFAGIFGSSAVTNTGGVLGDIWAPEHRGIAIVTYAFSVVAGPTLGPVAGGAIAQSLMTWRWTEFLTGGMQFVMVMYGICKIEETYPPAILQWRASALRAETGNPLVQPVHGKQSYNIKNVVNLYLMRPFRLLATPICFLMSTYAAFVYGMLYLCLAAVPIQFKEVRGWGPLLSELPFLALLVGTVIGGIMNILNNNFYVRRLKANNNVADPEARLPPMMIGSVFFAGGLFIFGWASPAHIHFLVPCVGLVFMGIGFFTIFQSALNYLIDTFQIYAASAVAATTFLRSVFAGVFPLFVQIMFRNLGIPVASSILGGIAAAMIPIPFLFYVYGKKIRGKVHFRG